MTATDSIIIDGYDLADESTRLAFPDHVVCGRSLNRGTATAARATDHTGTESTKDEHTRAIFPNTIGSDSPVIDLSYPVAGMFVASAGGTYLDLYQAVAQKLLDEHHPVFERTIALLTEHSLAFRREINTDDYLTFSTPIEGLHTSQELAALVNGLTAECFPASGGFKTFFSNSGAESGEAAIKLGQLHAYRRFLRKYDHDVLARVMTDLDIALLPGFDDDTSLPDPIYADYPFVTIGCSRAFHGRTLGVLNLTRSKKTQRVGYGMGRWFRHIPFNGESDDLASLLDTRPITEILDAPGGVSAVVAAGKVPVDLCAQFALEVYQGEGGYRIAKRDWLREIAATCEAHGILLGADEVQSFGRTGRLYAIEHYGVEPDILWMAKAAVCGFTVARADLADDCHVGWHSNTFGGGKLFDVNMAYATIDTLVNYEDPLFLGRTYLENAAIKGTYMRSQLAELSARHSDIFPDFSGLGCMWGLTVQCREEIIATGWKMGLKLLGCGPSGEFARLRILLLADVLTREIDEAIAALDRVFTAVEERHPDI